jgi:hypothetical protein
MPDILTNAKVKLCYAKEKKLLYSTVTLRGGAKGGVWGVEHPSHQVVGKILNPCQQIVFVVSKT